MKKLNDYTITDIKHMTEAAAFIYAEDTTVIKGHTIYFVDFGGYFGFSCLVFCNGKHIHYVNDYQLHHKKYNWSDDGTYTTKEYTKDELKSLYIDSLNNKLFTENELARPLKNYDDYTRKEHFIRNYYGMRFNYISMSFIGTDKERAARQRKIKKMHFCPISFAYYEDSAIPAKIKQLYDSLQQQKNNVSNNFEYQKAAFKHEMFNHEYSINWQADYDTLSAFGMIDYKSTATLDDYFNQLNFNDTQRRAYIAARNEYYNECSF